MNKTHEAISNRPMDKTPSAMLDGDTAPAAWLVAGETDPHKGQYDGTRLETTALGWLTDDELANGIFMNYDRPLNLAAIIAGTGISPIAWMTAGKERIRWLSRALTKKTNALKAAEARIAELENQLAGRSAGPQVVVTDGGMAAANRALTAEANSILAERDSKDEQGWQ